MHGHVDTCSRTYVSGWAIGDDASPAELIAEADGKVVGRFLADTYRPDLDQKCGFSYHFQDPIPTARQVRVYFAVSRQELKNSPFDVKHKLFAVPPEEMAWAQNMEMPPIEEMRLIGSNSVPIFLQQGTRMAKVLSNNIKEYFGDVPPTLKLLDFGCGVGRVLLPLSTMLDVQWHACDVNGNAIEYLRRAVPGCKSFVTGYEPSLPFDNNMFDCIYSISIWTHLPIALQLPWLLEIKRILRPGGLALISTSGLHVVNVRRERGDSGWEEIFPEDLAEAGIIYRSYSYGGLPGIDGSYGLASHDPAFIQRVWGQVMPVLMTRQRAIEAMQDLHMMTKL